jgi:hypothetical protein
MTTNSVSTRRRFFWKAGAALSAPLGIGAAEAAAAKHGESAAASKSLGDIDAIRRLQIDLASRLNSGTARALDDLFAGSAGTASLAGIRRIAPADFGERDLIELAADGRSAHARFHCAVETQVPIDAEGTLAQMARQQGDGFVRRQEARVLEADYVVRDGRWKIQSLRWGQSPS